MIAYYMDVHVPMLVTTGLRDRGIDALTAQEDLRAEFDDELLLERALELNRVMVTQDADFLVIADDWLQQGRNFPGVVYARQTKVSPGAMVQDLELIASCLELGELKFSVTHLPLR